MPKDSDNVLAPAEPSSLDLLNSVSVKVPILGADFLKHYNLLLDVSNQRVFSADSPTSPSIVLPTSPDSKPAPFSANLLATPQCITDLLAEFPDVVSSDGFMASNLATELLII